MRIWQLKSGTSRRVWKWSKKKREVNLAWSSPMKFLYKLQNNLSVSGMIPFLIQCESRRPAADSAIARLGGATTYRVEVEME